MQAALKGTRLGSWIQVIFCLGSGGRFQVCPNRLPQIRDLKTGAVSNGRSPNGHAPHGLRDGFCVDLVPCRKKNIYAA